MASLRRIENLIQNHCGTTDVTQTRWLKKSPREIAFERGFYDYSEGSKPDKTADEAFLSLENKLPQIRENIISEGFSEWPQYKDFLLRFINMLRARSLLFRQENIEHSSHVPMLTLTKLVKIVGTQQTWKYEPFHPRIQQEHERLLKNKAITDMRSEIEEGAAIFSELYWALRYTTDPTNPIIFNEYCCMINGTAITKEAAADNPNTLVFCPISWQMCLVGSPQRFDVETDKFHPNDLRKLQKIYAETARYFIVSPTKINL